jgi:hypothetical protein
MAKRTADNVKAVELGVIPPNYKGVVTMRIKTADFAPSKSSGKPMITLDCEIIHPLQIVSDFDGKTYNLDSLKCPIYISLSEVDSKGNPSDNLHYLVTDLLPKLDMGNSIDDENPLYDEEKNPEGLRFEGVCFDIIVESQQRKETRRKSDGSYEVLKIDGKEIIKGNEWKMMSIKNILRKSTVETNVAF